MIQEKFLKGLVSVSLLVGILVTNVHAGEVDPDDAYFKVEGAQKITELDGLLNADHWTQIFDDFSPEQVGWEWTRLDPSEYQTNGVSIGFNVKQIGVPEKYVEDSTDEESLSEETTTSSGWFGWAAGAVTNAVSSATRSIGQSLMKGKLIGDVVRTEGKCSDPGYLENPNRFDIDFSRSGFQIRWFIKKISVQICSGKGVNEKEIPYTRLQLRTSVEPGKWYPGKDQAIVKEFFSSQLDAWGKALHAIRD